MDIQSLTSKQVGNLGEKIACEYVKRRGMKVVERNVTRKTGEIDIVAREGDTLHFIEVKTIVCINLPTVKDTDDEYDPSVNLHQAKINRVARTSEWYVANKEWEGEWQVDAALVWLRKGDGMAKVTYIDQIL
jgi:putative endonuclease